MKNARQAAYPIDLILTYASVLKGLQPQTVASLTASFFSPHSFPICIAALSVAGSTGNCALAANGFFYQFQNFPGREQLTSYFSQSYEFLKLPYEL